MKFCTSFVSRPVPFHNFTSTNALRHCMQRDKTQQKFILISHAIALALGFGLISLLFGTELDKPVMQS